jgi:hypothetical protein
MKLEHVALVLLALWALAQTVRLWASRRRGAKNAARARTLGAEGERQAESLLSEAGYRIVARQAAASYELRVDGQTELARVRADFLVERDGRRFVADAKRGPEASRVTKPATRRQLLEYRYAYEVDGVLLIDAERGRVREVELRGPPRRSSEGWRLLLACLVGVLIGVSTMLFRAG